MKSHAPVLYYDEDARFLATMFIAPLLVDKQLHALHIETNESTGRHQRNSRHNRKRA